MFDKSMQYFSYGLQQITLHKAFLFLKNEKKNYEVARFKIYNHILPIPPPPPFPFVRIMHCPKYTAQV